MTPADGLRTLAIAADIATGAGELPALRRFAGVRFRCVNLFLPFQ